MSERRRTDPPPAPPETTSAFSDCLSVAPTHVLHLPVAPPTATVYLAFSRIASHKPPLHVGALYPLEVDTPEAAADGDTLGSGHCGPVSYLVRVQPLLPSHRLHLHPLYSAEGAQPGVDTEATAVVVCALLHAQLQPQLASTSQRLTFRLHTNFIRSSRLVPATRIVLQPHSPPSPQPPTRSHSPRSLLASPPAPVSPLLSSPPVGGALMAASLDGSAVTLSSLLRTDHHNRIELCSVFDIEPSRPPGTAYLLSTTTRVDWRAADNAPASSYPSRSTWLARVTEVVRGYDATVEWIISTMHRTLVPPASTLAQHYAAPRVFLLHGLPGTGKSLLVEQVCQHSSLPCLHLSAADLYQKLEGEGEDRIEATFALAKQHAELGEGGRGGACVIVDDIDAICPEQKNEAGEESEGGGLERALVAAFCRQLDELHFASPALPLFVFFTTSRLTRVSPSLLRQGRIDRRVHLPALTPLGRQDVLRLYSNRMTLVGADVELQRLHLLQRVGDRMHGYVAADVEKLCREVSLAALTRASKSSGPITQLRVSETDFMSALQAIRPANLSDLEYRLPKDMSALATSASPFADLAGLDDVIAQLQAAVIGPLLASLSTSPRAASSSALPLPSGLLLYGPSGCAKSSLALALALSSTLPPLIVQSTSLVSSVVGATEKNIAALFSKARASAPCVLILDQLDSIGQRRGGGGGGSYERMVACLLQELDGIGRGKRATMRSAGSNASQPPVLVIATSAHPELLDPALVRPGRLDYHCHLPPPTQRVRQAIVRHWLNKMPVGDESAVGGREALVCELAARTEWGSGADIAGVMREAGLRALRRGKADMDSVRVVEAADFLSAASDMRPSLRGVVEAPFGVTAG